MFFKARRGGRKGGLFVSTLLITYAFYLNYFNYMHHDASYSIDGQFGRTVLLEKFISNQGKLNKSSSVNTAKTTARITNKYKPKLILHVGPLKTGSTSIQYNVIHAKIFRTKLQADHYQEIQGFDFAKFDPFINLYLKHGNSNNEKGEKVWKLMQERYKNAYDKAINSFNNDGIELFTIHSAEDLSLLPEQDFTFETMYTLLEPWDVHVIMFYRPFKDWLPSMYKQYRKYSIVRPRDTFTPFVQNYHKDKTSDMTFDKWFLDMKQRNKFRDVLATYHFYLKLLAKHYPNENIMYAKDRIKVLQTYAPHGIEHEFLQHLPNATISYQYLQQKEKEGYKFLWWNGSGHFSSDLDFIVIEAWSRKLISIPRHNATTLLEEKMLKQNIILANLPMTCLPHNELGWISKRQQASENLVLENNGKGLSSSRSDFEDGMKQFCSTNANAVLDLDVIKNMLNDCSFHSPNLLDRNLDPVGVNPKWIELGCHSKAMQSNKI